jgi:hypothetical protein
MAMSRGEVAFVTSSLDKSVDRIVDRIKKISPESSVLVSIINEHSKRINIDGVSFITVTMPYNKKRTNVN